MEELVRCLQTLDTDPMTAREQVDLHRCRMQLSGCSMSNRRDPSTHELARIAADLASSMRDGELMGPCDICNFQPLIHTQAHRLIYAILEIHLKYF